MREPIGVKTEYLRIFYPITIIIIIISVYY